MTIKLREAGITDITILEKKTLAAQLAMGKEMEDVITQKFSITTEIMEYKVLS